MNVIDHGVWSMYTPTEDASPEIKELLKLPIGAIFSRNSKGVDWYVYRKDNVKPDTMKVLLWPQTNQVFGANRDVSIIFTANFRLIEIDADLNYEKDLKLRYYDDKTKTFTEQQ